MNPDSSKELFELLGPRTLGYIDDESLRMNQLSVFLKELSDSFDRKITVPTQIIDPTMFARLYALSQVQRTQIGISGFDPMSAIHSEHNGIVMAKVAPHHDEYEDGVKVYKTRVVKFALSDYVVNDQVDIFGINLYRDDVALTDDRNLGGEQNTGKLVVVDEVLNVVPEEKSIKGDTSIFTVINKETGDAKVYLVSHAGEDEEVDLFSGNSIKHISAHEKVVRLPDGHVIRISQLAGDLEMQVIAEIEHAEKALEGYTPENLTPEEKTAVKTTLTES